MSKIKTITSTRGSQKKECEAILDRIVSACRLGPKANAIWAEWPSIKALTLKLCWFISPYLESVEHGNVLQVAVSESILSFHECKGEGTDKARAYIGRVVEVAESLSKMLISVREGADWLLWEYDAPLMDWMRDHDSYVVQIRKTGKKVDQGQIAFRLASYVCTMRDLRLARITLAKEGDSE